MCDYNFINAQNNDEYEETSLLTTAIEYTDYPEQDHISELEDATNSDVCDIYGIEIQDWEWLFRMSELKIE